VIKKAGTGILAAALAFGTFGCSGGGEGGGGDWDPLDKNAETKLKVMYWSMEQFQREYGMLFQNEFPNVEIEVVSRQGIFNDTSKSREQIFNELVDKEQPDVLFLFEHEYESMARNGKLLDLDVPIKMGSYDMEGYNPAILSLLRNEGDGKLYGLSPFFTSEALFYNIDLFNKHNIELPRDSMTWDEVFELAKRFPTDGDEKSRIYGFTIDGFMPPLFSTLKIGAAQNLRVFNTEATEAQLNSDAWRKVFETIVGAVKSGAFYLPTEEEQNKQMRTLEDDRFVTGRSAMTFQPPHQVGALLNAKNSLKDVTPVNWGLVTAPVDPNNRTQSGSYDYSAVFAINSQSSNAKAAWEFIKYANSANYAQIRANSSNGELFSRTEFNRPQDERDMAAFFKLEPKAELRSEFKNLPEGLDWIVTELMARELTAVAHDKKTLDEAIQTMQEEAQTTLVSMKANQKK